MLSQSQIIHKSEQSGVADQREADDRLRAVTYTSHWESKQKVHGSAVYAKWFWMTDIVIMQFFVYDCLFKNRFQEKSRKELKDDNYIKFSRGSSELHDERYLLFNDDDIPKILCEVIFSRGIYIRTWTSKNNPEDH